MIAKSQDGIPAVFGGERENSNDDKLPDDWRGLRSSVKTSGSCAVDSALIIFFNFTEAKSLDKLILIRSSRS